MSIGLLEGFFIEFTPCPPGLVPTKTSGKLKSLKFTFLKNILFTFYHFSINFFLHDYCSHFHNYYL